MSLTDQLKGQILEVDGLKDGELLSSFFVRDKSVSISEFAKSAEMMSMTEQTLKERIIRSLADPNLAHLGITIQDIADEVELAPEMVMLFIESEPSLSLENFSPTDSEIEETPRKSKILSQEEIDDLLKVSAFRPQEIYELFTSGNTFDQIAAITNMPVEKVKSILILHLHQNFDSSPEVICSHLNLDLSEVKNVRSIIEGAAQVTDDSIPSLLQPDDSEIDGLETIHPDLDSQSTDTFEKEAEDSEEMGLPIVPLEETGIPKLEFPEAIPEPEDFGELEQPVDPLQEPRPITEASIRDRRRIEQDEADLLRESQPSVETDEEKIVRLHNQGFTVLRIAQDLHMNAREVREILLNRGITPATDEARVEEPPVYTPLRRPVRSTRFNWIRKHWWKLALVIVGIILLIKVPNWQKKVSNLPVTVHVRVIDLFSQKGINRAQILNDVEETLLGKTNRRGKAKFLYTPGQDVVVRAPGYMVGMETISADSTVIIMESAVAFVTIESDLSYEFRFQGYRFSRIITAELEQLEETNLIEVPINNRITLSIKIGGKTRIIRFKMSAPEQIYEFVINEEAEEIQHGFLDGKKEVVSFH